MTKQETTLLLEAIKNTPIVDGTITVTVCGTTFTFGNGWYGRITEEGRAGLIESVGKACRARMTRGYTKRELDAESRLSQKRLLWWKDNIGKTKAVFRAYDMLKKHESKWAGYRWYKATPKETEKYNKDNALVKGVYESLGIRSDADLKALVRLRSCVPPSWEKSYEKTLTEC